MIALLTSGVALGVHVPGLLLSSRLAERGVATSVEVIERLLPEERRAAIAALRSLFHRDLRVVRAARRLASDPSDAIDDATLAALHRRWLVGARGGPATLPRRTGQRNRRRRVPSEGPA